MAILKHIASKSSNYGAALEYLIFKHDEYRKTPILDKNGNRIMRDEFYLDGLNCEPYSFDAACQQLNREYQKNKNKNEIKSHHYIISFDPRDSTENCLTGKRAQELGLEYAKANFPGHQALVCTHMDGHNGSGNGIPDKLFLCLKFCRVWRKTFLFDFLFFLIQPPLRPILRFGHARSGCRQQIDLMQKFALA